MHLKAKLFLFFLLVTCVSLYAQDSNKLSKVFLRDGTTFNAYVEKQADGGYKLTTEDGMIFFYNENEIKSFGKTSIQPKSELRYWELKQKYSVKGYKREIGDKYNPAIIGLSSFLIPGLGQYITGCDLGWGIAQTAIGLGSLVGTACHIVYGITDPLYDYQRVQKCARLANADAASLNDDDFPIPSRREYFDYFDYFDYFETKKELLEYANEKQLESNRYKEQINKALPYTIASCAIWASVAIWSACSASKAAKIKNLYYRDVKSGVAYKFDFAPYIDLTAPVLASNQNIVSGLSFRVSF